MKAGKLRGASRMQPRAHKRGRVSTDAPANSAEFRSLRPGAVRADDVRATCVCVCVCV